MTRATATALILATALGLGCTKTGPTHTPEELRAIAKDATIWGFPLVDSYRIEHAYFVDRGNPEYKGPWNALTHTARVYTPEDKAIQSPNSDTPYSFLGADLRAEPLVLTIPAIEEKRYYSLQFIDGYTHNFAYAGSRSTGNNAAKIFLAGPSFKGDPPSGMDYVIRSETDLALVLYRTQLFGPDDLENVKKIQAGYAVEPLSKFLGNAPPTVPPAIDFIAPLTPEQQRTSPDFFKVLTFVLGFCPPNPADQEIRTRLARLGDPAQLSPDARKAVEAGMADAWKEFEQFKAAQIDTGKVRSGDLVGTREFLHGSALYRMAAAVLGIYGNSREEAMYPVYFVDEGGAKLDGTNRYSLRFPPGQLPPANAFWSLTLYELPASLLYA
ncbi:MAG TPA: DUF1254 domain-containing protein, partial [Candidatus Polarisedimenticolaceae bacterium]|nr:DUF1254 domain-containing protein [Candidatus Polarisedimenticolaceae bacterium]